MVGSALLKLTPLYGRLMFLEISNIRDFFNSDYSPPSDRKYLSRFHAFWIAYVQGIKRLTQISRQARQDYYALMRIGCFASKTLQQPTLTKTSPYPPLLIVPGLNTPVVFFREMQQFFAERGFFVSVMSLPANGMADIASCAEALQNEVEHLKAETGASKVNIIGHCLGGLIAHYGLETQENSVFSASVQNLISLGTGFLGAEGVQQLKNLWIPRNPGKPVPPIFDELIKANMGLIRHSTDVVRHNLITVWDFMVHYRKAILQAEQGISAPVTNHIIDDPAIDHLTIALNHQIFKKLMPILSNPV